MADQNLKIGERIFERLYREGDLKAALKNLVPADICRVSEYLKQFPPTSLAGAAHLIVTSEKLRRWDDRYMDEVFEKQTGNTVAEGLDEAEGRTTD